MRSNERNGRTALALAAAGLAMLGSATLGSEARANEVIVNETVCGKYDCVDGYEIKCKQPSRYLCVTIDASPTDDGDGVDFFMNTVETSPAAGFGIGFMREAGGNVAKRKCVARPDNLPDGLITAVTTVGSSTLWNGAKPYRLKAECTSWATGVKVTKTTKVTKKRDQ